MQSNERFPVDFLDSTVSEMDPSELSLREVRQILREVILGRSSMRTEGQESRDEIYAGHFLVDVEGCPQDTCWLIT